jgi:hypothetical protein
VRGADGSYYALFFTDEATRVTFGHCAGNKRDAIEGVEQLREELLVPEGLHLHRIRCDGAGDFEPLLEHGHAAGYEVVNSAPHTPQSNGIAERKVQEIKKVARCFMEQASLPAFLWPYAVSHAIYVVNRRPTSALDGKTPMEAWTGCAPDLSQLRNFGCYAFVRAEGANKRALVAGWRGRYIGNSRRSPGTFLVYNESTRQVIATRNVTFLEHPAGVAQASSGGTSAAHTGGAGEGAAEPEPKPEPEPEPVPETGDGIDSEPPADTGSAGEGESQEVARGPDLGGGRTRSGRDYTPAD